MTVWLVGMMGAGKTTVGTALATRLDLAFVDTDAEIVRGAGMSISEIFRREGEVGFRKREREAARPTRPSSPGRCGRGRRAAAPRCGSSAGRSG